MYSRIIISVISAVYTVLYHLALSAKLDPNSASSPAPLKTAVPAYGISTLRYCSISSWGQGLPSPSLFAACFYPPTSTSFFIYSNGWDPAHLTCLAFHDPLHRLSSTYIHFPGSVSNLTHCHPPPGTDPPIPTPSFYCKILSASIQFLTHADISAGTFLSLGRIADHRHPMA